MSDWRGGNDKGKKKPNKDTTPKQLPVIPPVRSELPPKTDWRGKARIAATASSGSERTWTGATKGPAPKTFVIKKSAIVGLLGLVIFGGIATFIVLVLRKNAKIPLIVSTSKVYGARDLGENAFSSQSLELTKRIPAKNIAPTIPTPTFNEQFLREVSANDNWIKSYSEIKSTGLASSGSFAGGGPGKNVTAYFVSCLIVRATDSDSSQWRMVAENDDPYDKNSEKRGLPIQTFLERVANQTKAGSFAWITLDVKTPTVVSNLGDLSFPYDVFDKAFHDLSITLQDRLILTLPCDEGQESWMAPEFSNSVFAHYFLQGIVAGFENTESIVTLDAFERQLSDKVRSWVAMNRVAHQTPRFLMSEKTAKKKASIQLFETTGVTKDTFVVSASPKQELVDKYQQLDQQWSNFETLKEGSRFYPLAYAEIEAQLIQLEEHAETSASAKVWSECLKDAELNIDKLRKSAAFTRRVSLIEAKSNSRVRPCGLFTSGILLESESMESTWMSSPPFWQPTSSATGNEVTKDSASLKRNDRCLQVWSVMQKYARADDAKGWALAFNQDNVARSLAYTGALESNDNSEWLEIQILRMLSDEIEWKTGLQEPNNSASKAVAKTLAAFSELQEIASSPNCELSWWTQNRLIRLDKEFLQSFDMLIANQFEPCLRSLEKLASQIESLKRFKDQLDASMESRDRAFRIAPHALASLMRLHRYVANASKSQDNSESQYEKLAKELGVAICRAVDAKNFLMNPDANDIPPDIGPNSSLDNVIMELDREFASQKVLAKKDAETIRNCRVALRWPLLPINTRREFHSQLANYYEKTKEEPISNGKVDVISEISHRSPRIIADAFKKQLKSINENESYSAMADRDWRIEFGKRLPELPTSRDKALIGDIYAASYGARVQASAYGQRASAHYVNGEEWPWNSVPQFQKLGEANYNAMQIQRLYLARWGDGDLNAPRNDKYFFQRLSNEYRRPRELLSDYGLASKAIETSPESLNRLEDKAREELNSIELRLSTSDSNSETNPEPWSKIRVDVKSQPWDAKTAIKLGRPIRKPLSPKSKDLAQAANLDQANQLELLLPNESLGQDMLYVSLRGHYHGYTIPKASPANTYQVAFQRAAESDTKLQVTAKHSDPFNVLILLDCSQSMGDSHEKAKKAVLSLLDLLKTWNLNGENPVQVGLIPFGLRLKKLKDEDKSLSIAIANSIELKECPVGDQIFYSDVMKGDEISKLESIVRSEILSPTGCTPLYDAIYFACTLQPERRTRIVVVSDGSNDVPLTGGSPNHIYYSGKNRNRDAVLEEIKRSKASLYPHQFKNDRFFNQPGYEEVKAEAEKSNAELRQLLNELIKIGRASRNAFLYDDFDSMIKDLLASFPRSKVRILSDDTNARLIAEGKFGEEIIIPRQRVPFWAIAEVESMGDNKLQKQRARVLVTGNQKLELQYKSDSNELNYIEFSEERDANQYNIRFETSETGLNLWARPIPDPHGGSKRELILEVAVRGKSAESERRVFTTPPKFAVAQLKPSSGDTNRSYLLGDVNFVSGTHYPILRFPIVPWGINKELFSKQADFEVWIADELPRNAIRAQLEANGSADLLGGRVQCIRSNNVVKVIVKSNDDERVFVVCPDAKSSNRTYPDNLSIVEPGDERHEFELGETSGAPVEIAVLKLSDLKNSNSQVELKHFYFRNKGVSQ